MSTVQAITEIAIAALIVTILFYGVEKVATNRKVIWTARISVLIFGFIWLISFVRGL